MKTALELVVRLAQWLTAGLFMGIFVLSVLQVVLRYLIGMSMLWAPDLLRLMFVWMVFLGAAILYARNGHLGVDVLVAKLAPAGRKIAAILVELMALGFFLILIFKGWEIAMRRMRIPFDTWDVPTGYAYLSISVTAVLMFVIGLDRLFDILRGKSLSERENVN
ncbi:TRAP transporter small permease [Martelella radicis]|uniref:TRAP transporter small permease protein n=1 Tax=Martelella radicis TaxID=1397476 RepID=A0A7W6KRF5_9HYPH|nr:TRAP transporter small permease [Martelella radicis]MBB4124613.1 TRAP-type C4-dicarboxylate transport system permease small subunit [Martelella radicis]